MPSPSGREFYHEVRAVSRRAPAPPQPACPECGGHLTVDEHALKGTNRDPTGPLVEVRAAFCDACEFVHEF